MGIILEPWHDGTVLGRIRARALVKCPDGPSGDPLSEFAPTQPLEKFPTRASTSGPFTGLAISLDRREAISAKEFGDAVQRLRIMCKVGLVVWPAYALLDLPLIWQVRQAPLEWYLIWRVVAWAVVAGVYLRIRREDLPGEGAFRALELAAFGACALMTAFMAVLAGGIDSSYALGILILMLVRAPLIPEPWRRGALPFAVMWACYPVTMAGAALIFGDVAAQFSDGRSLTLFLFHNSFLGGAAVLGTIVSHVVYQVRHEALSEGQLGRYQLLRKLGVGGMGEVWAAHDRTLRQTVALKVLKPELAASDQSRSRFDREVMATTRLTHPNTIRITDHGETPDGLCYYAMEFLEGLDLEALIRDEGALPPERAVHLIAQACGSLAEAHEKGFVHRDVKPENLYVSELGGVSDHVKVLDFGIAKVSTDPNATRLTQAGMVVGTPLYIAPEAIRGEDVDARSDVYAMGCVLFAALTGGPPFRGDTTYKLLMHHTQSKPEAPSSRLGRGLPVGLDDIVLRCLAKAPAQRYADAGELARALGEIRYADVQSLDGDEGFGPRI